MRTTVNGRSKLEVAKRGQDLEARGWECIQGITSKVSEQFEANKKGGFNHHFTDSSSNYFAIYEKKED